LHRGPFLLGLLKLPFARRRWHDIRLTQAPEQLIQVLQQQLVHPRAAGSALQNRLKTDGKEIPYSMLVLNMV
jgi:hypothetical protein